MTAIVAAASLASCSPKRGAAGAPEPVEGIALEIDNHHYLDITVYVVHDGQLTRLGVAGGSAHTAMVLPAAFVRRRPCSLYWLGTGPGIATPSAWPEVPNAA